MDTETLLGDGEVHYVTWELVDGNLIVSAIDGRSLAERNEAPEVTRYLGSDIRSVC